MKRIVQRVLNYILIIVFILGSTSFFIQSRKLKDEIRIKDMEIQELKDSITRLNVDCYSIKEHSEIK